MLQRHDNRSSLVSQREFFLLKMPDIQEILADFPPGPLDAYRTQATFDWKTMALVMDTEDRLKFKHEIWKAMEDDPIFQRTPDDYEKSLDDIRNQTLVKVLKLRDILPDVGFDLRLRVEFANVVGQYDWSVSLRYGILQGFFPNAVRSLGTQQHYTYIDAAEKYFLFGCVCLTEIGHGTNLKGLRTRATYDARKKHFVLHTPDFQAAKCWAANLGKTANFAYVMAQLYTPDGVCHGLHGFVVPIRDAQFNLLPGVISGDMGPKAGLNGLDNGFMMFDNYVIPKESLLNKNGDITDEGKYVSRFKDPSKQFGASLGTLSGGRVNIVNMCTSSLCNAITIAIRYSAVRRQFGNLDSPDELPVLEYQMQQCLLLPYLAAGYVLKHFSSHIIENHLEFVLSQFAEAGDERKRALWGMEVHAVSSSAKPFAGWLAQQAIQESREACGGHGYLKCAGLSRLRDDNDAFLTFEGANNVLMQQTSNWLIGLWNDPNREELVKLSSMGSLTFLKKADDRLKKKLKVTTPQRLRNPKTILKIYKWLVCHLLRSTAEKYQTLLGSSPEMDTVSAKNNSQMYFARTLSLAYIENFVLDTFYLQLCNRNEMPEEIRAVLTKLFVLFGLWSLERQHLGTLYEGGYFQGSKDVTRFIRENIVKLCEELKPDAVALVDAVAPTDFVLNSVLGASDGQVYKRLEVTMSQYPGAFSKSSMWKEFSKGLKHKL